MHGENLKLICRNCLTFWEISCSSGDWSEQFIMVYKYTLLLDTPYANRCISSKRSDANLLYHHL